jgi:hypothetical protein
MRNLIPKYVECIPHIGYDKWEDASAFLHLAIETTSDILLVLDFCRTTAQLHAYFPDSEIHPRRDRNQEQKIKSLGGTGF